MQSGVLRFLLFIAMGSNSFGAEMYRCEKDGAPIFSDKPCGPSATSIQIKEQPSLGGGEMSELDSGAELTARADRASTERRIREHEKRIIKHQKDMDRELSALKSSKRISANNLAGATRDVGISNEMKAVTDKYKAMIDTENTQIELLRRQLLTPNPY